MIIHKLASVFTPYGEGDTVINTGLRVAPQIASPGGMPIRFMGELFYLRQDENFTAGDLDISIAEDHQTGEVLVTITDKISGDSTVITYSSDDWSY